MRREAMPGATYRLQFNQDFTFRQAAGILDYLQSLGVTDVYASPLSRARKGSNHGYDVTDPQAINPEIGSEDEFEYFGGALRERRMGLLLDIVPNHMAASLENAWWFDLLARGALSSTARFFDVDWDPPYGKGRLRNRLLLPLLGRPYGEVLRAREIRLTVDDEDGFSVRYFDQRFPMSGASLRLLAIWLRDEIEDETASRDLSLLAGEEEPQLISDRILEMAPAKSDTRKKLERIIARINDGSTSSPPFAELDRLLDLQHYRLAFWRLASEELNYRRFFDISELAGLTIEQRETFEAVHRLPLELARRGIVTGLRIDHLDGLLDPIAYLARLQDALPGKRFYVVVEKILGTSETLRKEFELSGTTGYEFMNAVGRVFVDSAGIKRLDEFYREFTDRPFSFANVVYRMKRLAIKRLLPGELNRLAIRLATLAGQDRAGRDIPFSDLRRALIEISACLGVYRTYIRDASPAPADRELIDEASKEAVRLNQRVLHPAIEWIAAGLQLQLSEESESRKEDWIDLIMRWQQFTGPAMAKGFEDTALYRANRLISLNDVGSEPDPNASLLTPEAFHREASARFETMPHTLNATSTHDTKRSEDVRARINVLSEIPDRWIRAVQKWHRLNLRFKVKVGERRIPGMNDEWLLYQTLAGAWPIEEDDLAGFPDRIEQYVIKAAREAKMHTSWLEPDETWEGGLVGFARSLIDRSVAPEFLEDFLKLQKSIAFWGAINSLAQVVIKSTAPGIPDFYQGTELWDLSLVDPDNRRPVDYERRRIALESIRSQSVAPDLSPLTRQLMRHWQDGRIKLFTTWRLLLTRHALARTFRDGRYTALKVEGAKRNHVLAYLRGSDEGAAVIIVPRLVASLAPAGRFPVGEDVWDDTYVQLPLKPENLVNAFTKVPVAAAGKRVYLSRALADFPVGVLVS